MWSPTSWRTTCRTSGEAPAVTFRPRWRPPAPCPKPPNPASPTSRRRDDLTEFSTHLPAASRFDDFALPVPQRRLDEMPSLATGDLARDLALVLERLDRLGFEPFAVDCTREEIGVPVTSVYVPGLKEAPYG